MSKKKSLLAVLKETCQEWYDDNTSMMGAALAYYAVFAFAPLAVIAVAIAGRVYGPQAAQGEVASQVQKVTGPTVAAAIEDILRYSHSTGDNLRATLISLVVLLVAATSLFGQLQTSLNTIWGVQARDDRTLWDTVRDRLLTFLMVLIVAVLLLASLVAGSIVQYLSSFFHVDVFWQVVSWGVTLALVTLLFAMIYKWLPDVRMAWTDVGIGAAITAVLFTLGNYLIGLYLGYTSTVSAYGAAGSLISVLMWVYYTSQVFLFGAEFTQVYGTRYGEPVIAAEKAEPISEKEPQRKKLCLEAAKSPEEASKC